jgi:hypothetical protein
MLAGENCYSSSMTIGAHPDHRPTGLTNPPHISFRGVRLLVVNPASNRVKLSLIGDGSVMLVERELAAPSATARPPPRPSRPGRA